ncbi:MAG: PD-(D/E)XK nuclease family protein [Candidatus Poribacteria bacterium]|nr:PD-(D/E)XK nuclease family protein [Candidatus Poribacteria bacterium]
MHNVENILKTRIQNDEAHTFVVIVPTDAARLKRQRELILYHPNHAVSNLHVYTSEDFVQRLYNQVRPSRQHISSGLQNLWLNEIVNPDANDPDSFYAFRPNQNIPVPDSTLSLIADTINNLRERGESAQNIATDNPTETDLSDIYNRYEAKLGNRWVDEKGKHLYLANNFEDEFFKNAFPFVDLVVVEGFTVLSKADIKILKHIAEIPEIEMRFRTDCYPENEHLYKNITDLVQEFEGVDVSIDSDYERDNNGHSYFAENLFKTNTDSDNKEDLTDQIKVLEPADRSEEVEQIACLIQKHVSDGHCKLGDICVAYYNVGQYQQRIAEIFPAYGIPYSLSESIPLTNSEVVKEIFSRLSANRVSIGNTYFSDVEPASHTHTFHPDEFQEYVDDLLSNGEVLQHILNPMLSKNREIVESEVNAFQQFKKIVKELCAVLKSEGNRSDRLEDYIKKLHYVAKHTHYQNRASLKSETVKIVTLGELRSLEFDTVFLGDFVEGGFPPTYRPDPLFPENPYRTEEEQLHDNRFLFYRVLKSFRERLYLLVPKREGESELIPSIFQTQLEVAANIGEENIANPTCRSIPGFLSAYGNYVWAADTPLNADFPTEMADMRPLIDHVVSVEKSREQTHGQRTYEGILSTKELTQNSQEDLAKLRNEVYSVTDLETYAKCPFQYFVAKVLKSKVREDDVEDEPSSLEKGSLIHEVLCEFFKNYRANEDLSIAQCSDETFEQATQQLDEVLYSKSEDKRLERSDVSEDNLFWKIEIEKQRVALHKWLKAERSYDLHVMPRYFEVSFGQTQGTRDPELSRSEPISIGDVNMTGRIDRIDIGGGSYNVIDYKTGSSKILMNDILEGRSIQLPIYLQIVQKLLENRGITDSEPAAGLYHKIRLDECTVELGLGKDTYNDIAFRNFNGTEWKLFSKSRQLIDDELFDRRLTRVRGYVQQYVESISNGIFPLITHVETFVDFEDEGDTPITPKDITKPCNYCAYKRICRVGAFVEASQSEE